MKRFSHLIDLDSYPVEAVNEIVELAIKIKNAPQDYSHSLSGKIMATLFYEPSTRTQMSFQTAMLRLGGTIIGFDNPSNSSVAKGENLKDTTKIVSGYADIMVMRNPVEGSARAASLTADCPIINAGDGGHLHPTQTLTDLITIKSEKGRLDNLKTGFCGDLKNGRTVHSLLKQLSRYENNTFVLISTRELALPQYIKDILAERGCNYTEVYTLDEAIGDLDVLYMTRIQKERFVNEEEYLSQKNVYVLDAKKMKKASKDMIVLHPLPRVDEIAVEVDSDSRALYFTQAENGVFVRMALVLMILENKLPDIEELFVESSGRCCENFRCITNSETYLPHLFKENNGTLQCAYCDSTIE